MNSDDNSLIQRYKLGDEAAFGELYKKYKDYTLRIALRYTENDQDAEDIASEVWERLLKGKLNLFNPRKAKFTTWLYSLVKNLCIDTIKTSERRVSLEEKYVHSTLRKPRTPDEEVVDKETGKTIENALKCLPEREKMAFILLCVDNRSVKEVASILDCTTGAVRSLKFKARKKLRQILESYK